MKSAPHLRMAVAAAIAALTITACGGDAATTDSTPTASSSPTTAAEPSPAAPTATPSPTEATTTAGPVTLVDSLGGEVVLDAPAQAIVSLSPTATESLFAIGAGDQVVAVDEYSYFPEEAPVTDLSGFTPNVEAVASYDPDLVVIQFDPNDLVAQLDALDIPVLVQDTAIGLEDAWTQIEVLGTATGHADEATTLVESLEADLDQLVADAPTGSADLTYFHEISTDYYTTSSAGFIGSVYGLFGLDNIADEAAEAAGTEFPQMAEEAIIAADPDLVFITSGASPQDVAARPGWGEVTAVTADQVVVLPPDVPSRWGPRVVDFARAIAEALPVAP